MPSFIAIAYDYSRADWNGLHGQLRDLTWEGIFKLNAYAASNEFCEWFQVGIDAYIPHHKHQVKQLTNLHGFSAACAAA